MRPLEFRGEYEDANLEPVEFGQKVRAHATDY